MDGFEELNAVLSGEPAKPAPTNAPPSPPMQDPKGAIGEDTTPSTDPKPEEGATSETPPQSEETTPDQVFSGNRQNQAFAEMRTQIKSLNSTVARLGQIMGLPNNLPPEQLIPMVERRLLEIEAKASNIPVELAQRLEEAEKQKQAQEQEMLRNNAALAFQKVKDHYKLTQPQLIEFAEKLNEAGKNPYLQPVDLMQEYRLLYFDQIMENTRKQAEKEALARKEKVDNKSTTPPKDSGQPSDPATEITSIQGLTNLLSNAGR